MPRDAINLETLVCHSHPHEDIREGRLGEAVFATNLWAVVQNRPPQFYLDPEAFFSKTYLTAGLSNVLRKVARALAAEADAGDRILSLQIAFGGGKTHALVALWHLAHGHNPFSRAAGEGAGVRAAVFTNRTCDATQG